TLIDISEIRRYHYIQYLNIAHNFIVTLEPLSEMPFLQYLDASFNSIEQAFDFSPPLYLTTVNYSGNKIVHIPNLKRFWSIVHLNMSYNKIREIRGLQRLKFLTYLNLSHNKIRMLENLSKLNIETLILRQNNIYLYETENEHTGFGTLERLHTLDLANNQLTTLQFMHKNYRLENVDMENNEISNLMEIFYLKGLLNLKRSNIGPQVFPYDQPPPNVIAVIGPPASRKTITINNFFEEYGRIQLGVSHTSRKKRPSEIDGKNYYFIEKEEFVDMIKRAEFISATEFNGSHYGITHKELVKGIDSIVIFLCDLKTALTLKISGVNIKLVLALPKDELLHIKWAKDIYSLEEANYLDYTELLVVPVSASIRPVASGAYADDDIFEEDSGSMVLDTDESYSSVNEEVINDENPGDLIYSSVHSECSMQSNVMVMDSQRVMDKFDSLKQSQETKLAQYLQNINYDQKFGLQQKKNLSENIPGTVDEIVNLRKSELDEKSSIISAGSIQPHKKHKISEMDLLRALIVVSEKAANIARVCRRDEHLFELLVQKKKTTEANPRFVEDFKTLADVLIQEMVKHDIGKQVSMLG
uniref:Leucine-rich repeat and guanylate kinase domain-containing protein-like n=1 Tax=Diabrotica virgifera virgifera TaxID=50390 RepID=A0A6P7G6N6_DIAVI